jgi:hypothetical protein
VSLLNRILEPPGLWSWARSRVRAGGHRLPGTLALIAILGALAGACSAWLGTRFFTLSWSAEFGFVPAQIAASAERVDPFWATLLGLLLAPLLLAGLFMLMLPWYRKPVHPLPSLAVAVLGAVPVYAAAATMVLLPGVVVLLLAVLVSCFWWSQGAHALLDLPQGDCAEFTALTVLGTCVLLQFAGAALSGLL